MAPVTSPRINARRERGRCRTRARSSGASAIQANAGWPNFGKLNASRAPDRRASAKSTDAGRVLAARGERVASHRDGRGAPRARRDDQEYRLYLSEEQRSPRGCIARRMQPDFHHGLLPRTNVGLELLVLFETACHFTGL